MGINPPGIQFWRRPTLARPVAVLPSGLQRFTAVFGMGTGGTTALLSPECGAALAFAAVAATQARGRISGDYDWRVLQTRHSSHVTISKNCDSLISTYRRSFRLRTADATT